MNYKNYKKHKRAKKAKKLFTHQTTDMEYEDTDA
jgi:hypothetical protein